MYQLFGDDFVTEIYCDEQEAVCVRLALEDLENDIYKISGKRAGIVRRIPADGKNCMVVGTVNNENFAAFLQKKGIDVSSIEGEWEHYMIMVEGGENPCLIICGSDRRGAMWGIYDFCEQFLQVDPLYLWTEQEPERKESLILSETVMINGPKTYKFRGWFINDEDLLTGWSARVASEAGRTDGKCLTSDAGGTFYENYPHVLKQILETALRLKQNLIIPCSHLNLDDPAQEEIVRLVTERGLYISQHHQEPVGVLQTTIDKYCKEQGIEPVPGYQENPDIYEAVWRHSIKKWARYEDIIWQLGLRGREDRPLWYQNESIPDSMEARGEIISSAIRAQAAILKEEYGEKHFLSSSTLWMEGMGLYQNGYLTFPEDTMVIFADFGPNQMWGEGYDTAKRVETGEYGVYYHVGFWGCGPHTVQGNPPEKIYCNYKKAVEKGDTCYSILNVSNIREFVYEIECVARITWEIEEFDTEKFRSDWCRREFGPGSVSQASALYHDYFNCFYEMDRTDIEKQMLFMDGMARRVALKLLQLIEGEEFRTEDIQNKRLFDFPDSREFIDYYENAAGEGLKKWARFHDDACAALPTVQKERQPFFINNLIVQAELMTGLYSWVWHLARAARLCEKEEQPLVLIREELTESVLALEKAVLDRQKAGQGKWQGWYDGDELIGLEQDIEITGKVLQLYGGNI